MPALTAATSFLIGGASTFFSVASFRHATATARLAPVIAAVRVPPSACKNIAIDPHGARPEFFQIDHRAQRSPDQSLNFRAASIESSFRDVARFSRRGRVGQHRILGRQPAAGHALLFHPARHHFLDHHSADDASVAHRHQHRAARVRRDVQLEGDRANLIRRAAVGVRAAFAADYVDEGANQSAAAQAR